MKTLYNENDRNAAAWLRELAKGGHITAGDVNERSIKELTGDDLAGYGRVHLFAGIGGWDYALKLAGWPDDAEVWTGSCPCQPWSVGNTSGDVVGYDDPRHLWPDMYRLIGERRPPVVFGEQVANAVGKGWLDLVFGNLEASGYACGAAVLPALAVGARHERKRLFWCAYTNVAGWKGHQPLVRVPVAAEASQPVLGDPLARAWSAVDGNIDGLLHCDGVSVQLERHAVHGFGNAIVPQVAAAFITAFMEAR